LGIRNLLIGRLLIVDRVILTRGRKSVALLGQCSKLRLRANYCTARLDVEIELAASRVL
jgi:hypothetical protein